MMRAIMSEEKKASWIGSRSPATKSEVFSQELYPQQMEATILKLLEGWYKAAAIAGAVNVPAYGTFRNERLFVARIRQRKELMRMAVFRVRRNKGYTVMSNYHLKDRGLTLKSKGLLSMMLSLPDEWNYTTRGLAAICREGVDSIGAALREMEKAGYIVRNQLRDEKGRITDTEYVIYEQPHTSSPDTDCPDTENPYMDKPDMGGPHTENPAQLNTNRLKTDSSSTQKSNTDGSTIIINPSGRYGGSAGTGKRDG